MNSNDSPIRPLLFDLEEVPVEYVRQVSQIKRVLERWVSDPVFEEAFENDPEEAIASLGVDLKPEEIYPLIYREDAIKLIKALEVGQFDLFPISSYRYRAFINEKLVHRKRMRQYGRPANAQMSVWWERQVNRCANELGEIKAETIVHPPLAIELSKGCTVGCWFCGVSAPKFDHNWHYTPENAVFWKEVLHVIKSILGSSMKAGFLYWATDPLDNLDYEKFHQDFYEIAGKYPQTTTALSLKDVERTRNLINYTRNMDDQVDRFSVLSLKMMKTIHEKFTPEELIRVECIPQNREAKKRQLKSKAGRARIYAEKKSAELTNGEQGDTIACVSGFLINMPDREVQLVTPCQSTEKWPLGYWVIAKAKFNSAAELREILHEMVTTNMKQRLHMEDKVQLRRDLKWEAKDSSFKLISRQLAVTFPHHQQPTSLMEMLENGDYTMSEIALNRYYDNGVPMEETFYLLNELFLKGFTNEDPQEQQNQVEEIMETAHL